MDILEKINDIMKDLKPVKSKIKMNQKTLDYLTANITDKITFYKNNPISTIYGLKVEIDNELKDFEYEVI